MGKRVLLVGATGLVGQGVLEVLLGSPDIAGVSALVRGPFRATHPKLQALRAPGFSAAALADLDLYDERCWLGATITGRDSEEGGDSTAQRLQALELADGAVVSTWASLEPFPLAELSSLLEYLVWPCFVALGIAANEAREWGPERAREAQRVLAGAQETLGGTCGWYLKDSLRRLLPEGPYEGNLLSCGWRLK